MFKRLQTTSRVASNRIFHQPCICPYPYPYAIRLNFSASALATEDRRTRNVIDMTHHENTILKGFFQSVQKYPYRLCTIFDGHAVPYHELYHRVLQCAAFLRTKFHISPNDVVACITSDRPEFFQLILACHVLNCTLIPLNNMSNISINLEQLDAVSASVLIYEPALDFDIDAIEQRNINTYALVDEFDNASSWIGADFDCSSSELHQICSDMLHSGDYQMSNISSFMSSSGTTGKPKLITHSFSNKCIASDQYLPLFKHYPEQDIFAPADYPSGCRILLAGSTFHVTTHNILTCSAAHGHCAVIPRHDQRSNIEQVWKLLELYKVNASCMLSSTLYALLKYGQSIDGNHFKSCFITGELIPCELTRKFMKLMANGVNNRSSQDLMKIINFYGTTESEVIAFSDPISINCYDDDDLHDKIMTLRKIDGIELRINNNEESELEIATPCLMNEYYRNVEKTEAAISYDENDGNKRWYLVGEQVKFLDDTNESFVIQARNKDIFITDGSNCYPAVIENVILKHELVNGAVVIGVGYQDIYDDDGLPGLDEPIAFVTLEHHEKDESVVVSEILDVCEKHLQRAMGEIPFKVFVVEDIPKTSNGKILRDALRNMAIEYFKTQRLRYNVQ